MSSPEHCLTRRLAPPVARKPRAVLAGQEGLEPPTAGFGDRNSSQLSYCPVPACAGMHGPLVNHPPDPEVYVAPALTSNCAAPDPARPGLTPGSGEGGSLPVKGGIHDG